jgi:lipopolysaccharide export system protein LptA
MKKIFAAVLLSLLSLTAAAERADSLKPAQVEYDSADLDGVNGVRTLTGNVILTRGTLLLKADRAVVRETPEGYMTVTLTANNGKLTTFRQKRDGGPNLWVEGQAERIEYDERAELVRLYSNALIKELENDQLSNQVTGPFISYDSRKEVATVRNDVSGQSKVGGGRGTLILSPKRTPAGGTQ